VANTYYKTPGRIALALARLHQKANYANLITRINGERFVGALNDRLDWSLPGLTIARDYTWRDRLGPIIFDEIARAKGQVKLDTHVYNGIRFTDEEETLDLTSYGREILFPQVDAVASRLDGKVVTAMIGADPAVTTLKFGPAASVPGNDGVADPKGENALRQALAVKALCDAAGMPDDGRYLLAGASTFSYLAGSKALQTYDTTHAVTAFRRGVFGRIANMDVADGTAVLDDAKFIVLHPTWGVLANVAPVVPQGVTWGARRSYEGWDLRVVRQYDLNYLSDRSVVSTFTGITEVKDQYQRHTTASAATANDGSSAGDPIVVDGELQLTGKNVRIAFGDYVAS
jgi:hypothetical protein